MLKKLLKYEIKDTARFMLPIYGILIALSIIARIFVTINSQALGIVLTQGLSIALYVFAVFAAFVLTAVIVIYRFYKNLMTDEGYLMFTLPVKTSQLIVSKLLVSLMWVLATAIVFALSMFILVIIGNDGIVFFNALGEFFLTIGRVFGAAGYWVGFEGFITCLVFLCGAILQIYVAIAIGQLFNTHRVLAAIGAFIGIKIIEQILGSILIVALVTQGASWTVDSTTSAVAALPILSGTFGILLVFGLILSGIYFFGTHYILKTRLNLE